LIFLEQPQVMLQANHHVIAQHTTKHTNQVAEIWVNSRSQPPLSFFPSLNPRTTPAQQQQLSEMSTPGKGGLGRVVLHHAPTGARAEVYLLGAHVTSFVSKRGELGHHARWDEKRGGRGPMHQQQCKTNNNWWVGGVGVDGCEQAVQISCLSLKKPSSLRARPSGECTLIVFSLLLA